MNFCYNYLLFGSGPKSESRTHCLRHQMINRGASTIRIKKFFFSALILAAPFSIAYNIYCHGITVPFWDQWGGIVPLFEKGYAGTLTFSDIWAPHNEHRMFFPLIIMLTLGFLTDWGIIYELYLNMVFAGFTMFFLYLLLRKAGGSCSSPWFTVLLSFLIFSPVQSGNWLWGWQLAIFLSVLATVVSIWSVIQWPGQIKGLLFAIAAAVVATYSFNTGLLTWIAVGIPMIFKREWKKYHIALWTAAFLATLFFYYYDYPKSLKNPSSLLFVIDHLYDYVLYVLAYLGSPIAFGKKEFSIAIGLFLTVVMTFCTFWIGQHKRESLGTLLPWLSLASYAVLSAAATGIGRLHYGVAQALSSRYTTISTLFLISVLVVSVCCIDSYFKNNKHLPTKLLVIIASTLLVFSYTITYYKGIKTFKHSTKRLQNAILCLENVDDASDDCLKVLHPRVGLLRTRVKNLREMGLLKTPHTKKRGKSPLQIQTNSWIIEGGWALDATYHGKAPNDPLIKYYYGSWYGSDNSTGKITSMPYKITKPTYLMIYVAYGPDRKNQTLGIHVAGNRIPFVKHARRSSQIWEKWIVDLSHYIGSEILIVAADNGTDWGEWMGISQPVFYLKSHGRK